MKKFLNDLRFIIKEDKKIFFSIVLLFIFIISGGVLAISLKPYDVDKDGMIDFYDYWLLNQGQAYISNSSIKKLPQRTFTLDMRGIFIDSASGDTDSKLKEYNSLNKKIGEWKVDVEKKGHARGGCNPPMFNMIFDKFDSQGNPKPLFPGISTYSTNTTLQYQKVRAVENCDSFGDALSQYPFYGLHGAISPQFREYIVYRTMRLFGVPSVEPTAFAKLNILNAEPKYSNSNYYYMFMQRDNELDDQIPFVRQFGLEDELYQDGIFDWSPNRKDDLDYIESRLVNVNLKNYQTDSEVELNFNSEDSIRHFILSRFIGDIDRGILHNEDYGKIVGSDKYKAILYGFDFSFVYCRAPHPSDISYYINNISPDLIPQFQQAYYKVAREIFTNNNNLAKILLAIDQYPNPVSSRSVNVAKKYLKLSFYEYGRYFNSKEFADSINQPYVPIRFIPVMNENAYSAMRSDFDANLCKQELLPPPKAIIDIDPGALTYKINSYGAESDGYLVFDVDFDLTISADDTDLIVPKNNAFKPKIVNNGVMKNANVSSISPSKDFVDFGSYYLLLKGREGKIRLSVVYSESVSVSSGNNYYVYLDTFRPGADYDFIKLPLVKTEEIIIDNSSTCPKDQLISKVDVVTNDIKPRTINVNLVSKGVSVVSVDLLDINKNVVKNIYDFLQIGGPNSGFDFVVGNEIVAGHYLIRVSSSCNRDIFLDSQEFRIVDNLTPSLDVSVDSIKASLSFDNLHQEVSLDSDIDIHVKAEGNDVFFDENNLGYVVFTREDNLDKYPINDSPASLDITYEDGFELSDNNYKYVLREGNTGVMKLRSSRYTKLMFPGLYKAKLIRFFGVDKYNNFLEAGESIATSSNSVAIIGENSPYLFYLRKEPYFLTDDVEVNGERLSLYDKLTLTKVGFESEPIITDLFSLGFNNNKFILDIAKLKLSVGNYTLQVTGKKGNSNAISLSIIDNSPIAKKRILNMAASVWHAFVSFFEVKQ